MTPNGLLLASLCTAAGATAAYGIYTFGKIVFDSTHYDKEVNRQLGKELSK